MASDDVERQIAEYVEREIAYDRSSPILPDEPLLDGLIDSTSVLRLVLFVEERFGIHVDDTELVPEHFGTVRSLAELVESKQA